VAADGDGSGHAGAGRGSGATRRGNGGSGDPARRAALAFSPSPYDFGQVSPGQSAVQTFILSNSGRKATGKLRVRLSGPAAFSITRDTCRAARLRPGRACRIIVRFAPSEAGRITATLTASSKGGPKHAATASDVLTSSHIYWANDGGGADRAGTIWAANLDGSSLHAIVTGQTLPAGVAADARPLYWASKDDGTVNQASPDGSSPHAIVTEQTSPTWMAVTPPAP
jgi:hypothetical protein